MDESIPAGMAADVAVGELAALKARAIKPESPGSLVLAADTLVAVAGEPIGKPAGVEEAREMLQRLRGRTHQVFTGVCLRSEDRDARALVRTDVTMREYSDAEIEGSIRRGTPFDKAGAYAIQDPELAPVASVVGCYCNVVGLPLWTVRELLAGAGLRQGLLHPDQTYAVCGMCPLKP